MRSQATPAPTRPPRIPKTPPPVVAQSPRISALRAELTTAPSEIQRAAVLRAFWREVTAIGTPLVEAIDGDRAARIVTFLWRDRHGVPATDPPAPLPRVTGPMQGPGAASTTSTRITRAVVLLANKLTDPSVWEQSVLERLPGTDVWHRSYRMPSDWRATYQLAPDDGPTPLADADAPLHGPRSRWAGIASSADADPLCARRFPGKPGEPDASVVELEDAPAQPWRERRRGVARGSLTEQRVPTSRLTEPRRVWTYLPADAAVTSARVPRDEPGTEDPSGASHDLLVVLDGEDWADRLDLASTLDNLLADGLILPTAAVLVDAIDTQARWRELTCSDTFTDFLIHDLLPWAHETLPVSTDSARTTLSGRSLGGITALYAGLRAPDVIGAVHAQSPSLWWPADTDAGGIRTPGWMARALSAAPSVPAQISLEVGRQEWMLLAPTRDLHGAVSARTDVRAQLREYEGGHDAFCWRGGLADALVDLAAHRR